MKAPLFFLLLVMTFPSLAGECQSHSDCQAGCRRPGSNPVTGSYQCLPKGEVGARNGEGLCLAPPDAQACGCQSEACAFMPRDQLKKNAKSQ